MSFKKCLWIGTFPKGGKNIEIVKTKLVPPPHDGTNLLEIGCENDDNHVINDNIEPIERLLNVSKRNDEFGTNDVVTRRSVPDSDMTYSKPLSENNVSEINPFPKLFKISRTISFHFENITVYIY
jgi:hypothetical protein